MRFTTPALAALASLVATAAPASAATRFVCAEAGACEYGSIQAAVNASGPGDTIRVRSGIYAENVTIPAGKDGLTLRGAQAGDGADRPSGDDVSWLFNRPGTAVRVASSDVTVDGLAFSHYEQGVWSAASTSGLHVVNTFFEAIGNAIVPDSDGAHETVIRHNAFVEAIPSWGATPGYHIVTGASRGRLVVADNVVTGEAGLLRHFGLAGHDITVEGNRANITGVLATLQNVDGAVIQGNVVDSTARAGLAALSATHDVSVRDNAVSGSGPRQGVVLTGAVRPSSNTLIEGNDFSGTSQLDAIAVAAGSISDTLVVRYNRFAPGVRGLVVDGTGLTSLVDAKYNWWGCNEGPNHAACAVLDPRNGATVSDSPRLTLSLETDSDRIANPSGGTTGFRLSLLRDSAGRVHQPPYFPSIRFTVASGALSHIIGITQPQPGLTTGTLVADRGAGEYLVGQADSAEVHTLIAFGPAPDANPEPDPNPSPTPTPTPSPMPEPQQRDDAAAASAPGPAAAATTTGPVEPTATTTPIRPATPAPSANVCKASARTVTCVLAGKAYRASRARGVKATLYRSGRRIAAGSVRLSGGKAQLRVGRRVAAGRYDLVLTRAGRRLARQAVVVSAR